MMTKRKYHDLELGALLLLLYLLIMHCLPLAFSQRVNVEVQGGKGLTISETGALSSFQKITLGLPVSLNLESPEGLTAVPGIGLRTADRIVKERNRRGKFTTLEALKSIKGIGPIFYKKIKPFLML